MKDLLTPTAKAASAVVAIVWNQVGDLERSDQDAVLKAAEEWTRQEPQKWLLFECTRAVRRIREPALREEQNQASEFLEAASGILPSIEYESIGDFEQQAQRALLVFAAQHSPEPQDEAPALDLSDLDAHLKTLQSQCGTVELTGLLREKASPTLPIEELYISLSSSRASADDETRAPTTDDRELDRSHEGWAQELVHELRSPSDEPEAQRTAVREAMQRARLPALEVDDPAVVERLRGRLLALEGDLTPEWASRIVTTEPIETGDTSRPR